MDPVSVANPPSNPSTTIFLQDACLQHRYIRTKDSSHIVERPERLRAVKIGLCAAIARLEEALPVTTGAAAHSEDSDADLLVAAIGNLRLEQDSAELSLPKGHPVQVVRSSAKVDILNHPAVKYVHGDVDGDVYLEKLVEWARHSAEKISNGQSEIPSGLLQGDLYSKVLIPQLKVVYSAAHLKYRQCARHRWMQFRVLSAQYAKQLTRS
jgi:histone deacetylase HOS3